MELFLTPLVVLSPHFVLVFSSLMPPVCSKVPPASCWVGMHDLMCSACLGRPGKRPEDRLSDGAWQVSHDLRAASKEPLPPEERGVTMLQAIWRAAYPDRPCPPLPDPEWKALGFQGANPFTDFRAGVLPLRQMLYLSQAYPEALRRLALEARHEYPLAVCLINLSFLLVIYLELETGPSSSPTHGQIRAPPR